MARIVTLGCRLNQYESARIRKLAEECGDDVIIVNTCTVTGSADSDARKAARKLKRENPGSRVIVYGCAVRGNSGLFDGVKEIDHVVRGEEELAALLKLERRGAVVPEFSGRTRALIKIQEGCDNRCSYCVVPLVRGSSRSRNTDEIEREFLALLEKGYKEIVLTGTHIADFGKSNGGPSSLPYLLARLLGTPGDFRLRLSSIEMSTMDDGLVSLIGESGGRICPHLHIPIQSASPKVLREMNRGADVGALKEMILGLKKRFPEMGLGADFINAFPAEGEKEFLETYSFIEELPLAFLHIFTFSPRPGTPAARLSPLPRAVVAERKNALHLLAKKKRLEFYAQNRGKVLKSLTLENQKALSGNFIEFGTEKKFPANSFVDLRLFLDEKNEPFGVEVADAP